MWRRDRAKGPCAKERKEEEEKCFLSLFIYSEREREHKQVEEGQREGKRKNPKQAQHCQHRAQRRAPLTNHEIMT